MKPRHYPWLTLLCVATASIGLNACSAQSGETDGTGEMARAENAATHSDREEHAGVGDEHAERGEHGSEREHGEGGEHAGEHAAEGEESGEHIARGETWDQTRNGARLILAFDTDANAFVGTVANTTGQTLCAIRVEVHLSSGTELGPTDRTDIPAGERVNVELASGSEAFDSWTAHPEMSRCAQDG